MKRCSSDRHGGGGMQVEMALRAKHGPLVTVRVSETDMTAARLLRSGNFGLLVAKDSCGAEGDAFLGLLSEWDALHAAADHGSSVFSMPVSASMTSDAVTCQSYDIVDHALGLMNEDHVRHIPVPHGEGLVGVISIRNMLSLPYSRPPASPVPNSIKFVEA